MITICVQVPSNVWARERCVPTLGFRTLPENGWGWMERNMTFLNVQKLHERGVSITSGTTSSVRVNPGVNGRPKVLHYEKIATTQRRCVSVARCLCNCRHYSPAPLDKFQLVSTWWPGEGRGTIDSCDRYDIHMTRLRPSGTVPACTPQTRIDFLAQCTTETGMSIGKNNQN